MRQIEDLSTRADVASLNPDQQGKLARWHDTQQTIARLKTALAEAQGGQELPPRNAPRQSLDEALLAADVVMRTSSAHSRTSSAASGVSLASFASQLSGSESVALPRPVPLPPPQPPLTRRGASSAEDAAAAYRKRAAKEAAAAAQLQARRTALGPARLYLHTFTA